ncbi:MAG TPA: hypothetical protein VML55_04055 [Planctomycetaceae bacterium]|nr:hypothetical protein [Planctomycetaceae bacterium]
MDIRTFQANRARFPDDDLRAFDGCWVAFSGDGTHILASAETLDELERHLATAGVNAAEVGLERIDFEEASSVGGAELL